MRILTSVIALSLTVAGCSTSQDGGAADPSNLQGQAKRVLIITGVDYPGHKWQETTPVLANAIARDDRLSVSVTEKPSDLAAADLSDFDTIVLHFMDWEVPDPGPQARANLEAFVRNSGGLVLVHFACGAFQEWSRFPILAGRAWDPKLRGHDPRGVFTVEIADAEHPITRGMAAFETDDELYTCLAGDTPIHVLVMARSKVDKKDYPIAFVLKYGRGKVFHCVLGHDVKALANPSVGELFRRGTAWTASLSPVPAAN